MPLHNTPDVRLKKDEELVISKRQKSTPKLNEPSFTLLGAVNLKNPKKVQGLDMAEILKNLSKAETELFWTLEQGRDRNTNLSVHQSRGLNKTEKNRLSAAYQGLKKKHLVKRVYPGTYLINPKAMLPANGTYIDIWNSWCAQP